MLCEKPRDSARCLPSRPTRQRRCRRGVATLEFLLTLPLVVLGVMATIQFGMLFANMEHGELASRIGAVEASQTPGLAATAGGDPVPGNIIDAIETQIDTVGLRWCKIRLEHNVGGTVIVLESTNSGSTFSACPDCGPTETLTTSTLGPPSGAYVRLTVCVPKRQLMPDCIQFLGVALGDTDEAMAFTSVYRYEL